VGGDVLAGAMEEQSRTPSTAPGDFEECLRRFFSFLDGASNYFNINASCPSLKDRRLFRNEKQGAVRGAGLFTPAFFQEI
jgi:hypothetical protein